MNLKPPNSDAAGCIEALFDYLELDLSNRVAAKQGRTRCLDATKLSNIGSNAGLAHPNKVLTPMASGRWRHCNLPMAMSDKKKMRMRNAFMYYCSWADKHNYLFMSRSQFLHMCQVAHLIGPKLDSVTLTLLFEKINLESQEPIPGSKIGLNDWLNALMHISYLLYPELSSQEAFDKVSEEHVLEHAAVSNFDPLGEVVVREDVMDVLLDSRLKLYPIFNFYVKEQLLIDDGGDSGWKERQEARNSMPFNSFARFAQDFEIVPELLGKARLAEAFRCSRFGPAAENAKAATAVAETEADDPSQGLEGGNESLTTLDEDLSRIVFDEFVEAVGRLALMAFNYKPPLEIIPTMGFQASYAAAAKRLWLDATKKEQEAELSFPDEVIMPGAGSEYIGHEDSPHADDVMSRAASKVFTKARSVVGYKAKQTKRQESPNIESMPIHDEMVVLPDERPLHLKTFSTDWVGRPSSPPNDFNATSSKSMTRGQDTKSSTGWYSAEQGLPSKYMSRAEHMIEARVNREQAVECLKLKFQAEQRKATMTQLESTKAMRTQLQATSGQKLTSMQLLYINGMTEREGSSPHNGHLAAPQRVTSSSSLDQGSSVRSSLRSGSGGQKGVSGLHSLPLNRSGPGAMPPPRTITLLAELQGLISGSGGTAAY